MLDHLLLKIKVIAFIVLVDNINLKMVNQAVLIVLPANTVTRRAVLPVKFASKDSTVIKLEVLSVLVVKKEDGKILTLNLVARVAV
jgi:hypothetical protein